MIVPLCFGQFVAGLVNSHEFGGGQRHPIRRAARAYRRFKISGLVFQNPFPLNAELKETLQALQLLYLRTNAVLPA